MKKRLMSLILAGSMAVSLAGTGTVAMAAETTSSTETDTEAEEGSLLGALLGSLIGGSDTLSKVSDAAGDLLGEDGALSNLLGEDSDLQKLFSSDGEISKGLRKVVEELQDSDSELSKGLNELVTTLEEKGGEASELLEGLREKLSGNGDESVSEELGDFLSGFIGEDGSVDLSGVTSLLGMLGGTGSDGAADDSIRDMYREMLESGEESPVVEALNHYILEKNEEIAGEYPVRVPIANFIAFTGEDEEMTVLADLWEVDGHIEENVFDVDDMVTCTAVATLVLDEESQSYVVTDSIVKDEEASLQEFVEENGFELATYESESRAGDPDFAATEAALKLVAQGEQIDSYYIAGEEEAVSIEDGEKALLDYMTSNSSFNLGSLLGDSSGLDLSALLGEEGGLDLSALLGDGGNLDLSAFLGDGGSLDLGALLGGDSGTDSDINLNEEAQAE